MNSFYDSTRNNHSIPELEGVLNAVTHFGCLLKAQAIEFMPKTPYERNEKFKRVVNNLKSTQRVKENGDFLTSMSTTSIDYELIDAVWTMMEINEKLSIEKKPVCELIEETFAGTGAEKVSFILNKEKIVHLVPISTDSSITNALFLQDKYFARGNNAEEKDPRDWYFFIFRNKEVAKSFTQTGFTMPHGIAFLEGEPTEKPVITLYSPKTK